MKRALILPVALLIFGALWIRGCSGPRPEVVSARMRGPVAVAVIRNRSGGEGAVAVDFRVKPKSGGASVFRTERAALRPHEETRVETRIDGARGDEEVEAEVDYPPR